MSPSVFESLSQSVSESTLWLFIPTTNMLVFSNLYQCRLVLWGNHHKIILSAITLLFGFLIPSLKTSGCGFLIYFYSFIERNWGGGLMTAQLLNTRKFRNHILRFLSQSAQIWTLLGQINKMFQILFTEYHFCHNFALNYRFFIF